MNIIKEFSRFAHSYQELNSIQNSVVTELVSMLRDKFYRRVLDIGSGSGAVYMELKRQNIHFNRFTALDLSRDMLRLHPNSDNISKLYLDFNDINSFKSLSKYDLVISSSALQWSSNFDITIDNISSLSENFYFSIFTSNTFKSLHLVANLNSPIYSADEMLFH